MASLPAYLWINGVVRPTAEASISPFDHGFMVGDGAFETLPARNGQPFALRRHWERLVTSCLVLGITPPSIDTFRQALQEAMEANGLRDARLRFTITSGDGPPGSDKGHGQPNMVAIAVPLVSWPPTERIITVPWTRNETGALVGVKSTSYAENVRALAKAKASGAGEAILANTKGELCEGTGSNIFIVMDGRILTPPLSSGCLPGITRALVIAACEVEERTLPFDILSTIAEAFLTSSTRDVHPIAAINARPLQTGELTQKAAKAFAALAASSNDP